jgi:hypothetical protein
MAAPNIEATVKDFGPDVIVADNHIPTQFKGMKFCTMWHGLGWKARGKDDLRVFYREVARLTGHDPRAVSSRFLAQCYGESDHRWRVDNWKLHPDSCHTIGMCYSDLLLDPPYTKQQIQSYYDIDILEHKVVLLSVSWHYGRIVSDHKGGNWLFVDRTGIDADMAYLNGLLSTVKESGANCILCLHDKKRYEKDYLAALLDTAGQFDNVQVKHKSDNPDNLADLVAADVMVSNLSSFVTFFYFFGRPSVHIVPVSDDDNRVSLAKLKGNNVAFRTVAKKEPLWMNHPEDNGGITARSLAEVQAGILQGLQDPSCCKERSARWIQRHVHQPDGRSARRFVETLRRIAAS